MSYNTKNYKEQGGKKWVIDGELVVTENATVTGLIKAATATKLGAVKAAARTPETDTVEVKIGTDGKLYVPAYPADLPFSPATAQAASEATTVTALKADFNALLANLKDSGYMTPDAFNLSSTLCTVADGEDALAGNHAAVESVTVDGNAISIVANVADMTAFPSAVPAQGTHKWIGILITTGLADITVAKYNGYQLTADDVTEAIYRGGQAGDIVMWLKCNEIATTPKTFTLSAPGYAVQEFTVSLTEPEQGE